MVGGGTAVRGGHRGQRRTRRFRRLAGATISKTIQAGLLLERARYTNVSLINFKLSLMICLVLAIVNIASKDYVFKGVSKKPKSITRLKTKTP